MARLRELRERLGFSPDEVAAAAGWARARQREIERSDEPDASEADVLSGLYGVDVDDLLCSDAAVEGPPVAALLKAQAETLSAETRFRIAEAATVAREVRALQELLELPTGWSVVEAFGHSPDYGHPREGAAERLAKQVRSNLGLGYGPIESMGRVLEQVGAVVLWGDLPAWIDAFSLATPETGAVLVASTVGTHMTSAFGRRVTWAHELCHVLFDRPKMREIRKFCAVARAANPSRDDSYEIERRARAFALYFLAPRDAVEESWGESRDEPLEGRVRLIMDEYGIGYEATRSHLSNLALLRFDEVVSEVPTHSTDRWEAADPAWSPRDPVAVAATRSGVSTLRAGVLLRLVADGLNRGLLTEAAAREYLHLGLEPWEELRTKLHLPSVRHWRTSTTTVASDET